MKKRFFQKNTKTKWLATLFLAGIFFLGFFEISFAQESFGTKVVNGVIDWAGNPLLSVFNLILSYIFSAAVVFLNAASWLLDLMLSAKVYKEVFFSDLALSAIKQTWTVVRDFFNIFFMLALILVAIGTILRVPKFSDKKIITNVIVGALLINFSLPIALVIIDFSQLAMTFFMQGVSFEGSSFTSRINQEIAFHKTFDSSFSEGAGFFISIIFSIIFVLVLGFMFLILALSLLIRVIAYWVLLILSPMAMVGIAFGGIGVGAEQMFSKWLSKMSYYSFFGPVLVFFLWIALNLTNAISELTLNQDFNQTFNVAGISSLEDQITHIFLGTLNILIPYFVAVYLLFYGYDISQGFAVGTTNKLMKWGGDKMQKWGKTWGQRAAVAGALGTGVGALGYLGYNHARNHAIADLGARKKQIEDNNFLRLLTKKGRADIQKEREQKYESRIVDGKKWGEVKEDFKTKKNREGAHKISKDWKEKGMPSESKLKEILLSGSASEKIAAAQELSKLNKLGASETVGNQTGVNLYAEAIKAAGKDTGLVDEINREAVKKNKFSIMKYNFDNNTEKFREEALKHALKAEKAKNPNLDEVQWRADYAKKDKEEIKKDYYRSQFGTKLKDLADQDVAMHKDPIFEEYMKERLQNKTFEDNFTKFMAEDRLDSEKLAVWENIQGGANARQRIKI